VIAALANANAAALAAAYPKIIAAGTTYGTFNPASGGRRSYASTDRSYASPNFLDVPSWANWPAGGPLVCPGYTLQMRVTADRFEMIGGGTPLNHHDGLEIGGTGPVLTITSPANALPDSGYVTATPTLAGAIKFHDYVQPNNSGGTAFTGNIVLFYQYARS
jgi:hypothetical protein